MLTNGLLKSTISLTNPVEDVGQGGKFSSFAFSSSWPGKTIALGPDSSTVLPSFLGGKVKGLEGVLTT